MNESVAVARDEGPRIDPRVVESLDGAAWLWKRMALSATPCAEAPRVPVPVELRSILRLLEIAANGSPTGGPSVPSAGALYPYEHYAVVAGTEGPAVYGVDVARRGCRLLRAGSQVERALDRADLALRRPGRALVLNVVRPWLSMRKYGNRGYLYAQLDAAHLATHLLCLTRDAGGGAELRTRIAASPVTELLALDPACRFLHSVLVVDGGPEAARSYCDTAWTCSDVRDDPVAATVVKGLETECWQTIAAHRAMSPVPRPHPVRLQTLIPGIVPPPDTGPLPYPEPWTGLAARRRSAKDFADLPLTARVLRYALAALATPLTTDLSPGTELGTTLVVRDVTGWRPGSYPLHGPAGLAAVPVAPPPSGDEVVRVCMGQEHLRHAAATVLFHAPREEIVNGGARGVDDALLRAGALAHLLYLGATAAGVAVTGVGGFDADRWRALTALPEAHDVLYVVMLGVPGNGPVKLDRLSTPHRG
ncbi:nitroreductase family protein [Sphaerisporangium sp. NPDC088356]|uniref:nitroreductase family protein n=1 Tax=Sphaerisporangium sp. NPDC088356 TaxID=3154871 RepID=UPI00342BAF02